MTVNNDIGKKRKKKGPNIVLAKGSPILSLFGKKGKNVQGNKQ